MFKGLQVGVTEATYLSIFFVLFLFSVDFFINGRVLKSPKLFKKEIKYVYQMLYFFVGISSMGAFTAFTALLLFVRPSPNDYVLISGAVTFASIFSGLCFAAGSTVNGNSKQRYIDCGRQFLDATLNFFYLIIVKYGFDFVSEGIKRHGSDCPLRVAELWFQVLVGLVGIMFLIVGCVTFTIATHSLQKETIMSPD